MISIKLTLLGLLLTTVAATAQTYKMAGPFEVVARDGEYSSSKVGSERDMKQALLWAEDGHFNEAANIIEAYADKLQRLDGHDAPLCAIQCFWLVKAMNIIKQSDNIQRYNSSIVNRNFIASGQAMIRRAMLPMMEQFEADSPYANGNWGAIVNRLRMACAIFLEDSTLYHASVDYYLHGNDNGSLPCYIGPSGQCQETGRDQTHVQLGLGALCETAEMAWQHGDDLWGALDNRLMKGLEYTARYNLGYDVPFQTWTDCTGLYNDWNEPGAMGRGHIREIYDAAYAHYVGRCHLKMPYTKKLLTIQKKAERRGIVETNLEARTFVVPGVSEGKRLHKVFTYPAPKGAPLKHDYDVFVQPRGSKEWTRIDTYMAKVNAPLGQQKHKISEISYVLFDFTGDVFVRVVAHHRKFRTARIRPDYRGTIANVLNDSTVQFLLFQPENLSVEFDGSITDNLLVFTSHPPKSREEAEREAVQQGRHFLYYPPGYYAKPDSISIPSGTTVYLEGGSYFAGTFTIDDARDVSIIGRGIARPSRGYEGCRIRRGKNILIDGLVVNTCPVGASQDVTMHDVRCISHPGWGDGLNVFASSNVLYDRVFCRTSDDCTTAYATRKGFEGSVRNVRMRNSTLWADVAHPIFIGLHGAAAGPHPEQTDSIVGLTYENIDILCQSEPQVDYQGCLAINVGDNNLVRDVVFDNIRIESIHQGSLLHLKVGWNQKYCAAPGRGLENVTFHNVRYKGQTPYMSVINGYDEQRKVRNITFEGLKINGRHIHDKMPDKPKWYSTADYVPIFVGNHVEGIVFK